MKVSYKEKLAVNDAVAYLENIAKGLKEGNLSLNYGEESVDFTPNKEVNFEIKAEGKDRKGSLSIDIAYKNEKIVEENVMTISAKKADAEVKPAAK